MGEFVWKNGCHNRVWMQSWIVDQKKLTKSTYQLFFKENFVLEVIIKWNMFNGSDKTIAEKQEKYRMLLNSLMLSFL